MKTNIFVAICAFFCCSVLFSCKPTGADFGTFVHYNKRLGKEYIPDTLHKKLIIDADAFTRPVKLALYKEDSKSGKYILAGNEVQLYVNGKLCQDKVITITSKDKELDLGIVFNASAKDGTHRWHFHVVDAGEIECINGLDVHRGTNLTDMAMFARFDHQWNPRTKVVFWTSIGLVVLLLLWLFVSRVLIWRSTKFSTLYMDYCDGYGQKSISMAGKYELVCTNNAKMKDSALRVFFVGKRQFEYNDFWTEPVTIKTGARANSVRIIKTHNFNLSGDLKRREVIEIINADGKSVKVETT